MNVYQYAQFKATILILRCCIWLFSNTFSQRLSGKDKQEGAAVFLGEMSYHVQHMEKLDDIVQYHIGGK